MRVFITNLTVASDKTKNPKCEILNVTIYGMFRTPRQMEAQANTTREQSNKNNIYDVGW